MEIGLAADQILKFFSCVLYAVAATLFFKKTFPQAVIPAVVCLTILGTFLGLVRNYPLSIIILLVTVCVVCHNCYRNKQWLQSAIKLDMFLTFSFAIIDVQFKPVVYMLTKILDDRYTDEEVETMWFVFRIFLTSVPQFIRKPIWLKARLQGLRSKLGPIYVLNVAIFVLSLETGVQSATLGNMAVVCAVVAGLCFRPDNSAMLDMLGYPMTFRERRYNHGRLMIISFSSCVLLFVDHYTVTKT